MKRFAAAAAALVVTGVTGCSSTSTSPPTTATSRPPTATTPMGGASSTPVPDATSTDPSTTTNTSPTPTTTGTNAAESLGKDVGAKIAFYAIAKAAGMNDSEKMDELAEGICSRIESGKQGTVGPWMKDTFQLGGDVAAKVAITAIEVQCPQFKSLVGQ